MIALPSLKALPASTRWIIYGAVVVAALAVARVAEKPDGQPGTIRARSVTERDPRAEALAAEAARIPELDLGRLTERAPLEAAADLFHTRSWNALAAEEARSNAPPPPPPPAPQAPPLPFAFLGKLIDGEQVTVFLTDGTRNWVVRAGDTIEGGYRVEAIGAGTMTLTYLALGIAQELAIGEATSLLQPASAVATLEPLPAPPQSAPPLPGQVPLLLSAPSRVASGNELIVSLALKPGGAARRARIELAYDASALAAVGAPSADVGRLAVELGGATPLAQVRFRAIAQSSVVTRIGIARAVGTDARGASVSLAAPDSHSVTIVQTGG